MVYWSQEKRNEEAKKLLAEAGYSADKPLTFNLLYNTSDLHKKLAIAAASLWRKNLGIDVKLVNRGVENVPRYPSSGHL